MASVSSSLTDFLKSRLEERAQGKHKYFLSVVSSRPVKSYAAFPHATQPTPNVFVQNVLIILQEHVDNAVENGQVKPSQSSESVLPQTIIEAALYTIPKTRTLIIYISKVDTTGLVHGSPLASELASGFFEYYLGLTDSVYNRVRIQLFTRAQTQYVFLGSAENPGKRVQDDRHLVSWWRYVLTKAAANLDKSSLEAFYVLPGYTELEAREHVSPSHDPMWKYGHPYNTVASPFEAQRDKLTTVMDMIPAFADDPKSRFFCSLSDSKHLPAGEDPEQDWDGHSRAILARGRERDTLSGAQSELSAERQRERRKVADNCNSGTPDTFWEQMGWRQECCGGVVVAFLFLERSTAASALDKEDGNDSSPKTLPLVETGAISHKLIAKWFGQLKTWDFNVSRVDEVIEGWAKLSGDLFSMVQRDGANEEPGNVPGFVRFSVDNPVLKRKQSVAAAEPQVNTLVSKKKKKKI